MKRWSIIAIVGAAGLGGSLSAHLAGAFSTGDRAEAVETIHRTGGPLPLIVATAVVALGVALVSRARTLLLQTLLIATSPVVSFVLQERLERLLSAESSPFGRGSEPSVLAAALALLPWILATILLVRAIAAVARVVAAGAAPSLILVPSATGRGFLPTVRARRSGRHDPILDRPPRAPPRP